MIGVPAHFDIIATLNTGNMAEAYLKQIVFAGATIIRLNGSFLDVSTISETVSVIRRVCGDKIKILLDLPGFKPRFVNLDKPIRYKKGEPVVVPWSSISSPSIITQMDNGDVVRIKDGMVRLVFDQVDGDGVTFIPDSDGHIQSGKGFFLEGKGQCHRPHFLSKLDERLIEVAKASGIDFVGISFVRGIKDVWAVRRLLEGSQTGLVPKIEAREAFKTRNLFSILSECKLVIVDRGDACGEMGIDAVWSCQREVLDMARVLGCRVIMATQFFTSMMERPLPSIAEVDSLLDLLNFGIDGVQLSEETCVGQQGVEVVRFVSELVARKRVKPSKPKPGKVVWIMGLTSSGKTTIAYSLAARLSYSKVPVTILDGDEARTLFGPNFSFEAKNRLQVIKSIVHHAKKAVSKGDNVIVSALTAGDESRKFIKDEIENLTIIYLDCPIEECIIRDEKGLYAKAINGKIDTIAGINFEYPIPNSPHLVLNTLDLSVDECVDEILGFLILNNKINLWGNLSL